MSVSPVLDGGLEVAVAATAAAAPNASSRLFITPSSSGCPAIPAAAIILLVLSCAKALLPTDKGENANQPNSY
jgi:hypothetical protein